MVANLLRYPAALACSLSAPGTCGTQRRAPSKKPAATVKQEEDAVSGPSASQPESASQEQNDIQTIAAVMHQGLSVADEADDAAVALVDRLAGKPCNAAQFCMFAEYVLQSCNHLLTWVALRSISSLQFHSSPWHYQGPTRLQPCIHEISASRSSSHLHMQPPVHCT